MPERAMKTDRLTPRPMRAGRVVAVVGTLLCLAIGAIDFFHNRGDSDSSIRAAIISAVAAWECAAASTIYSSAKNEIKKLNQRIAELEKEKASHTKITSRSTRPGTGRRVERVLKSNVLRAGLFPAS